MKLHATLLALGLAAIPFAIEAAALLGALVAGALVVALAARFREPETLILLGVSISAFAGALSSLVYNLAPSPVTTAEVVRHSMMMSLAAASSAGEWATVAPRAITAATASLSRSITIGSKPFFCRHSTMLPPMMPRPMKPMTGFFIFD